MFSFIPHYRTAWSDYFPGINPTTTLVPKEYTSREPVSSTYVYVFNCLFNKCSSTSNGGALYCSTSVTYLLVESSSFFSCKTSSSSGGAIYFCNTNSGECVFHKICGNDCSAGSSNSQFVYTCVKNLASSKNYVNYSSIIRCVTENSGTHFILRLDYGKIYCPSVNISMNKCVYYSGISCVPFTDSSSITCSFLYTSFTDNTAIGNVCIHLNCGALFEIKCCNILRNSQNNLNTDGTIRFWGNTMIEDSCILENTATYTFNAGSSSFTVTLSNCTIDKTTINPGSLTIIKTVTKSFIHALNHMSTQNCHAKYDSAGTLTPITQPPLSSKKIVCYCTFNIPFCHSRLRDIISTVWVFMLNFIHPYDRYSQKIINVHVL
jgi:predicted outer membrane repeat protein